MNRQESKYQYTASLMDEALLLLLEQKDYDTITVKEVCQKAGVNRSTFYLHYHDSDQEEIHEGAVEIIDHYPGGHTSIDVMSENTLYKHLPLTDVIEHVVTTHK